MGFATLGRDCARLADATILRWIVEDLSCAVDDVDGLRNIMRSTGAVITGDAAIHFLDRASTFEPQEYKIVVPRRSYHTFLTFLIVTLRGYVVERQCSKDKMPEDADEDFGIVNRQVVCLGKYYMDVICSATETPLLPIANFHSTIAMNFITADAFCIAYPATFFVRRNIRLARRMRKSDLADVEEYCRRGYPVIHGRSQFASLPRAETGCFFEGYCAHSGRYFGDSHCLFYAFDRHRQSDDAAAVNVPTYHSVLNITSSVSPSPIHSRFTAAWTRGGHGCQSPKNACCTDAAFHASVVFELIIEDQVFIPGN